MMDGDGMKKAKRKSVSPRLSSEPPARDEDRSGVVPRQELGKGLERQALMVMGMHRSGTSALAGLLSALGCDGPATPMKANESNPKGYFESSRLMVLHDEILLSAGSSWRDYRPFPQSWLKSPKAQEYRGKLRALIEAEYGDSSFFVVKDPRICRFLPLWTDTLLSMKIQPLAIMTHRNPIEVARSLVARENYPLDYGLLLWLRHVLDAEADSRNLARAFTSFDRLTDNWAGSAQELAHGLGITWPRYSPVNAVELREFVDVNLRHHRQPAQAVLENDLIAGWIRDSYAILERWVAGDTAPGDRKQLDRIRQAFDESAQVFGPLVSHQDPAAVGRLTSERDVARKKLQEADRALTEQAAALARTEAENQAQAHELKGAASRLAQRKAELDDLRQEIDAVQADRAAAQAGRDDLARRLEEAEAGKGRQDREMGQVRAQLQELRKQLETRDAALALQEEAAARHSVELAGLQDRMDAERAAADQNLAAAQEQLARARQRITVQEDRILAQIKANREVSGRIESLRRSHVDELSKRKKELERMRESLRAVREDNRALLESTSWRMTAPFRWIVTKLCG